jgi:hypothetical protein
MAFTSRPVFRLDEEIELAGLESVDTSAYPAPFVVYSGMFSLIRQAFS